MANTPVRKRRLVMVAASLVAAVLGSIHAFSVFLTPLEAAFGASRGAISLTYSLALVSLTLAVLLGPRIFDRWAPAWFVGGACLAGAFGAGLAAMAPSLPLMWIGYSLIFGAANGLGYGFGLQIAAQVRPGREGVAMGIVTAAYAMGAVVSPGIFSWLIAGFGFRSGLAALALTLVLVGGVSSALFSASGARFQAKPEAGVRTETRLWVFWLGYFGAALAGLMVIGHAAGLAMEMRPDLALWSAPATVALTNLAGSLTGGRLADRVPLGSLLATLAGLSALALIGLAAFGASVLVLGLGLVGFAYGGTITAFPAAIAKRFGSAASPWIYGRIFTAWGVAGLIGPWLAGALYDLTGSYQIALIFACTMAGMAGFALRQAFRPSHPRFASSPEAPETPR